LLKISRAVARIFYAAKFVTYTKAPLKLKNITSSVYDRTVEDVEYIYNKFSP